jgi:hypothetical protein
MRDDATFRTKYDAWLVAILALSIGGAVFAGVVAAVQGQRWGPLPALAVAAFIGWTANTTYTFRRSDLFVRSGPFRWRIPVADVTRVEATGNPLSSPAWSLDRLAVHFRRPGGREGALMISPKDKDGFLAELRARCPSVVVAS